MKPHPTGLIANDDHVCPAPPYIGQGWKITLCEREHPHAAEIRAQRKRRLSREERRAMIIGRELVIHAADEQTARTAALLLHAAYCLIEGGMFSLFPGMANRRTAPSSLAELKTFELPKGPVNAEGVLLDRARGMLVSQTGFVIAAQIAALVSRHPVLEYCLFEYYLSTYLVTIDARDLHPRWGLTHFAPSPLIIDHVWFAQAVALAHSVIEELGVNVRASGTRPSVGPDGEWNPEVKDDLVRRLAQAGIERPDAPITIVYRGTLTALEDRKPPRRGTRTRWHSGDRKNRDQDVPLIDAINWLSRLRSDVSAHKLSKSATHLTVLDAFSAQSIARHVLLCATGFWDEANERLLDAPRPGAGKRRWG